MLVHQAEPTSQQIAHRTLGLGVDIPLGQQPEAQQLGQPGRVGVVVSVFQPAVLHDGRSVGQVYPVACLHQRIHQPVPVVGRLHDQATNRILIRRQRFKDCLHIIAQPFPIHDLIRLIRKGHNVVV